MLKPAITVLIVLGGLTLVSWDGRVAVADIAHSVSLVGYELRVEFNADLERHLRIPSEPPRETAEGRFVADSAEVR